MASFQQVIIVGNLGRDPEVKQNGNCTSFSVATTRKWKDNAGNQQEETEWHRIACFGKTAEAAARYLHKGSSVFLTGRLQTKEYTDKQGVKRSATGIIADKIVFLSSPKDQQQAAQSAQQDDEPW